MKFIVNSGYDLDLVYCPDMEARKLEECQMQFDTWLYEEDNRHMYYFTNDGGRQFLCVGTREFVEWLNQYIFNASKEKAEILKEDFKPSKGEQKLSRLYI